MDSAFQNLISITRECGQVAVSRRNNDQVQASQKQDKSWVSNVDKELSTLLIEALHKLYPEDQIVSEEEKPAFEILSQSKRQWYIDPIDGTSGYLKGNDGWAVQIGCIEQGVPCKGIVYQADTDRLFYAEKGHGAFLETSSEKRELSTKDQSAKTLQQCTFTHSPNYADPAMLELFQKWGVPNSFKQGSLGMKLMIILENKADFFLNTGGKTMYWDLAGPEAIFLEAGGKVLNAQSAPPRYDNPSFNINYPYICFLSSLEDQMAQKIGDLETIQN